MKREESEACGLKNLTDLTVEIARESIIEERRMDGKKEGYVRIAHQI
ncbi:15846_t:CDS:2, partial [Gigaspora margarita]